MTTQSGHAETWHAGLHFAATFWKCAIYYIFFLLLFLNVFCLQLAPVPERAPAQHTTHSPVRRASQCERERTRVNERHRDRERGQGIGKRRRDRQWRRRRCSTSCQSLTKDMSIKHGCAPHSDIGHILCLSSIVVIMTTSLQQAGYPWEMAPQHSRWNKAHHMAKHHLDEFPSKKRKLNKFYYKPITEEKNCKLQNNLRK